MIPDAWRYLSYGIPYTWGSHAFIHINSMGATLFSSGDFLRIFGVAAPQGFNASVTVEWCALWLLTLIYFLLACILFYVKKTRLLEQYISKS